MLTCAKCGKTNLMRLGEPPPDIKPGVYFGGQLGPMISNSVLNNAVKCNNCQRIFCFECIKRENGVCPLCGSQRNFENLWV